MNRTTVALDEELLARAKRALGLATTQATIAEALRRAAEAAEAEQGERARLQSRYLQDLSSRADIEVLRSEQMWR